MSEFLRVLLSIPGAIFDGIWARIEQASEERFIAEQQRQDREMGIGL